MLPQSKPPPQTPPGAHYCGCSIHFRPQESSLSWQPPCPYGQSETDGLLSEKCSVCGFSTAVRLSCHCEARSAVAISCRLVAVSIENLCHCEPVRTTPWQSVSPCLRAGLHSVHTGPGGKTEAHQDTLMGFRFFTFYPVLPEPGRFSHCPGQSLQRRT